MAHRRVSKRDRPRRKRTQFASVKAAVGYANSQGWPITEHVSTLRGDRIQVVSKGGPRTLRVKGSHHDRSTPRNTHPASVGRRRPAGGLASGLRPRGSHALSTDHQEVT